MGFGWVKRVDPYPYPGLPSPSTRGNPYSAVGCGWVSSLPHLSLHVACSAACLPPSSCNNVLVAMRLPVVPGLIAYPTGLQQLGGVGSSIARLASGPPCCLYCVRHDLFVSQLGMDLHSSPGTWVDHWACPFFFYASLFEVWQTPTTHVTMLIFHFVLIRISNVFTFFFIITPQHFLASLKFNKWWAKGKFSLFPLHVRSFIFYQKHGMTTAASTVAGRTKAQETSTSTGFYFFISFLITNKSP